MPKFQLSLAAGEMLTFEDERSLEDVLKDITHDGYLRIKGQRTVMGTQGLTMEGDYAVFARHIVSVFI